MDGILAWQVSRKQRTPTPNMMGWMQHFHHPCPFECCFSSHCASIKCMACQKLLTTLPPLDRFVCIDCKDLDPDDDRPDPVLCRECFESKALLHQHGTFFHIDAVGHHASVQRAAVAARHFVEADFALGTTPVECVVCCSDEVPAFAPGCTQGHSVDVWADDGGFKFPAPSGTFMCLACHLGSLEATGRVFMEGQNLCVLCQHEADCDSWRREFAKAAAAASAVPPEACVAPIHALTTLSFTDLEEAAAAAAGDSGLFSAAVAKLLTQLHRQPWLQAIIEAEFHAPR